MWVRTRMSLLAAVVAWLMVLPVAYSAAHEEDDHEWLCIGTLESCEAGGVTEPAPTYADEAPPPEGGPVDENVEPPSEEGESPGDQVQALSERGRVVNDFIWRDGPRRLDYFSCNQQGCRRVGTVEITANITLREPRESVIRMVIKVLDGPNIKPRLVWDCRGTNGPRPDTSCGRADPNRFNSPGFIRQGETFAITQNPAIFHRDADRYFYDYRYQWEVQGQGGLVDTTAFDGSYQSVQFECPGGARICRWR